MDSTRYTYWEDDGLFIGYLEEFSDYMTQGLSLDELKENLRDIYGELNSGTIPAGPSPYPGTARSTSASPRAFSKSWIHNRPTVRVLTASALSQ